MRIAILCVWILALAAPLRLANAQGVSAPDAPAGQQPPPGAAADAQPQADDATGEDQPGILQLDDPIEPFQPDQAASAEDRARVEAASLYAAGRMQEQQEDQAAALRLYQRALRHDPDSLPILRDVVRLAFQLDRNAQAVRYALKAVELDASDPTWLRQLGMVMTEEGDLASALDLYERALQLQTDERTAAQVLLSMEAGKIYALVGQPAKAAEAFGRVMTAMDKPGDYGLDDSAIKTILGDEPSASYRLMGNAFLAAQQADRAAAAFASSQKATPDEAVHAYNQARVEALRRHPAEALAHLEKYFQARAVSQAEGPYELLASLLKELGQSDELIARLEKLRREDQGNAPLRAFLAKTYFAAGDAAAAEPLWVEAVEQAPTPEAFQGLAGIYRQTKREGPLLNLLEDAAAKTGGLELLGDEAVAIARDAALLDALLQAARKRHAEDADSLGRGARLAIALLTLEAQRLDAAEEFFDLALKVQREDAAELLLTWGLGLLTHERYAQAASVFQRGIDERALPSDNPAFHFYLSGALAMDGKTDEALVAARTAAGLVENSPRLESRIPWILYFAKRYGEADRAYRDFIEKFDEHQSDEVRESLRQARLVLSNIAVIENDLPRAEEWLEQVLDEFPDDVSAMNDLGYLWADQGKHLARALEMIQRAVAAEPDNAAYRDSLGWVLYRLGRHDEAIAQLERAAQGDEPDAVILDHLGDALAAAGREPDARNAWERALKAFEAQSETEKADAVRKKLDAPSLGTPAAGESPTPGTQPGTKPGGTGP